MSPLSSLRFSAPSKVFIAGEYLALSGGPALLATVRPRFFLQAKWSEAVEKCPFHVDSPAGLLWEKYHRNVPLESYQLIFEDPFQKQGGFGGSTAEFLLLAAVIARLEKSSTWDIKKVWCEYREICHERLSGADLVAQGQNLGPNFGPKSGGLIWFDRQKDLLEDRTWAFEDLGFLVAKTPFKIKTHEHLQRLGDFDSRGLKMEMDLIQEALVRTSSGGLIEGLQRFTAELDQLGFVCSETKSLLEKIDHRSVRAKKGCGALGADVILVVFEKSEANRKALKDHLQSLKLVIVADENCLSPGLQWSQT